LGAGTLRTKWPRIRHGGPPSADDPDRAGWHIPKLTGEHDDPSIRPGWRFYHNTIASFDGPEGKAIYMLEMGGNNKESRRWVYNNIHMQLERNPNNVIDPQGGFFAATTNIHFSIAGVSAGGYPAGDIYADPKIVGPFVGYGEPAKVPWADFRLSAGSPAIDAGTTIPPEWPDPLRNLDAGAPDIGALPYGIGSTSPLTR
jgi:hypothetical protein